MLNKNQKGFVDPLSLLTIAFLVVSLFVGTAVVSNEGFNFDIREKAAPFLPDEAPEIQKAIKKAVESNKSIKEKQEIVNKGVEEAQERERQEREEREREEEEARRRQEENARNACEQEQGRWVNGRCQTQNTPPSSGSGGTSLADGTCTSVSNVCGRSGCAANQKCQYSAAAGRPICVADAECSPTPTNTSQNNTQDTNTSNNNTQNTGSSQNNRANGECRGPNDRCSSGQSYFDTSCPVTETRCGTRPSSPSTTPTENRAAGAQPSQVQTGPVNRCSIQQIVGCEYGCEPTTGRCKSAPVVADTSPAREINTVRPPQGDPIVPLQTISDFLNIPTSPGTPQEDETDPFLRSYPYCHPNIKLECPQTCQASVRGGSCPGTPGTPSSALADLSLGGSEGISLAQSGSCKIGDKTYPAGETIIGTVRANGKEIWRCSGGKFVPCDTCGYTDLTVVPAYAQNIINTEKPCYSKSGLAIAHGETADRHISRTTGEWVVNRCVNGRWVEDATTDVATIRPAYETLGRPELRSCIAGGQIVAPGSTTHTATGLQICRNGELSEAQCVPGISFCQEGTRSFCDDRGFVVYQNCQNGCNEVTGACSTTPGETPEKATTVAGKCSGPNDASCNGFCSPTPYGYYCMETDFEQLRDLRCSGNYLQGQEPNGAWTTLKKCNALAGGCSVSGDSYSCTTDVEVEEIIAQQEREKEQVLSECRSTCANSIQGDTIGTCVLRESDSGTGFAAECVRQPSGLAVQSIGNFRGYGSYGGGSCGGIGQQCCNSSTTYTNTDLRGQACNTGLACGTDNTCLVNQAAQIANATATLIRDQNVNADQVISLVQLNQSITNSDAFYAALAQNSGNLCQNCSDGQCLYSSSGDSPGFRCVATEDIENYYREQNPDSKGTGSRELAGELGQDCRRGGLLWLSRVCNHDWLTCGTSNKCELTTSARAIVGNESVTSGDTEADYINTILLPQAGIQNQETAYELARLACSNNGEFFVKYGRCWECLNSNTNAITGREMAFCTGTNSLRQSLPGYQCRNAGGYCAPEDVVGNDGISSVGSANDCNIGFSCVTRAEGNTAQADVNDYCYENQRAAGTDSYKECAPGLVCHNNYCQDKPTLAYVPDYANSAAATQIEEFIPLLKFFVGPQIRTLDPTYYESTNIRAQDMLWVQQNLQTNRDELFTENPDLEEINLESALFEGLDEAAQARAVIYKAEEDPALASNWQKFWLAAGVNTSMVVSTWTGEPPLSRGGASGTNAFFRYGMTLIESKEQEAVLNQQLLQGDITQAEYDEAVGFFSGGLAWDNFAAASTVGLQTGFFAADVFTGASGLARTVAKANNPIATTVSNVLMAPERALVRTADWGIFKPVGVVGRAIGETAENVLVGGISKVFGGVDSVANRLAKGGLGSETRVANTVIADIAAGTIKATDGSFDDAVDIIVREVGERINRPTFEVSREIATQQYIRHLTSNVQKTAVGMSDEALAAVAARLDNITLGATKDNIDVVMELADDIRKLAPSTPYEQALLQARRSVDALELAQKWNIRLGDSADEFISNYSRLADDVAKSGSPLSEAQARDFFESLGEGERIARSLALDNSSDLVRTGVPRESQRRSLAQWFDDEVASRFRRESIEIDIESLGGRFPKLKEALEETENISSLVRTSPNEKALSAPPGASAEVIEEIDRFNQIVENFEANFGNPARDVQIEKLALTMREDKIILQIEAGGGKTSVVAPISAALEGQSIVHLSTKTDAVDFVNQMLQRQSFFEETFDEFGMFYFDNQRGFLEIVPGFDPATARVVSNDTVRELLERAAADPERVGITIATQTSDLAWGTVNGRAATGSAANEIFYEMVDNNFSLIGDEAGVTAGSRFSVSLGDEQTISKLTDSKLLSGLESGDRLLQLSERVKNLNSLEEFRQEVLTSLRNNANPRRQLFRNVDLNGVTYSTWIPADTQVITNSYKEILEETLASLPDSATFLRQELERLIGIADSGNLTSLNSELTNLLQKTDLPSKVDTQAIAELAYQRADLHARWETLYKVPGNEFGQESGLIVLRKTGETTGEQFQEVARRIALQEEGAEMLRAAGVTPNDTTPLFSVDRLTVSPDSSAVSMAELYETYGKRVVLFDATPSTAQAQLGILSTDISESAIRPRSLFVDNNLDNLAINGVSQVPEGKALSLVISDDSIDFATQTNAFLRERIGPNGQGYVARTRYRQLTNGDALPEYFVERVTVNSDGVIDEVVSLGKIENMAQWNDEIQRLLDTPDGLTIVFEGRNRAVDLTVTAKNQNIHWQQLLGEGNNGEHLTQGWKRNRIPARGGEAAGWSDELIVEHQQYDLLVRADQNTTRLASGDPLNIDNVVSYFDNKTQLDIARFRAEDVITRISKESESVISRARDYILENKPLTIRSSRVNSLLDELANDAHRVDLARTSDLSINPLSGQEIADDVYFRGLTAHEQRLNYFNRIQSELNLSEDVLAGLRTEMGLDKPFISKDLFDNALARSLPDPSSAAYNTALAVNAEELALQTGPSRNVLEWAQETSAENLNNLALFKQSLDPETVIARAQAAETTSQQLANLAASVTNPVARALEPLANLGKRVYQRTALFFGSVADSIANRFFNLEPLQNLDGNRVPAEKVAEELPSSPAGEVVTEETAEAVVETTSEVPESVSVFDIEYQQAGSPQGITPAAETLGRLFEESTEDFDVAIQRDGSQTFKTIRNADEITSILADLPTGGIALFGIESDSPRVYLKTGEGAFQEYVGEAAPAAPIVDEAPTAEAGETTEEVVEETAEEAADKPETIAEVEEATEEKGSRDLDPAELTEAQQNLDIPAGVNIDTGEFSVSQWIKDSVPLVKTPSKEIETLKKEFADGRINFDEIEKRVAAMSLSPTSKANILAGFVQFAENPTTTSVWERIVNRIRNFIVNLDFDRFIDGFDLFKPISPLDIEKLQQRLRGTAERIRQLADPGAETIDETADGAIDETVDEAEEAAEEIDEAIEETPAEEPEDTAVSASDEEFSASDDNPSPEEVLLTELAEKYGQVEGRVVELAAEASDARAVLKELQDKKVEDQRIRAEIAKIDTTITNTRAQISRLEKEIAEYYQELESIGAEIAAIQRTTRTSSTVTKEAQQARAQEVLDQIVTQLDEIIGPEIRQVAARLSVQAGMNEADARKEVAQTIRDLVQNHLVRSRALNLLQELPEFVNDSAGAIAYSENIGELVNSNFFLKRHMGSTRMKVVEETSSETRITSIGDIHGDWNAFVRLASGQARDEDGNRMKPLLDKNGRWIGGENDVLMLTGDIFDRSPAGVLSSQTAEKVMRLQQQAGNLPDGTPRIKILLGNHDAHAIYGYWLLDDYLKKNPIKDVQTAAREIAEILPMQPGIEADDLFYLYQNPEIVQWVLTWDSMAIINGVLYMHSDTTQYLTYGSDIRTVNETVRGLLNNNRGTSELYNLLNNLTTRRELTPSNVDLMLGRFGARHIVHGHDQNMNTKDDRVTNIDGGLSESYARGKGVNRGRFATQRVRGESRVRVELEELRDKSTPILSTLPLSAEALVLQEADSASSATLTELRERHASIQDLMVSATDDKLAFENELSRPEDDKKELEETLSALAYSEEALTEAEKALAEKSRELENARELAEKAEALAAAQAELSDLFTQIRGLGFSFETLRLTDDLVADLAGVTRELLVFYTEIIEQYVDSLTTLEKLRNILIDSIPPAGFLHRVYDYGKLQDQVETLLNEAETRITTNARREELIKQILAAAEANGVETETFLFSEMTLEELEVTLEGLDQEVTEAEEAVRPITPAETEEIVKDFADGELAKRLAAFNKNYEGPAKNIFVRDLDQEDKATEYISRFVREFPPKFAVTVEGRVFYFTDKITYGPWSTVAFAYTKNAEGRYVHRIFSFSGSQGEWRSTPGFSGTTVSKGTGIHYTQEAKPDKVISDFLSQIQDNLVKTDLFEYSTQLLDTHWLAGIGIKTFENEVSEHPASKEVMDGINNLEAGGLGSVDYAITPELVESFTYPEGFIPNFNQNPLRQYQREHGSLGLITYQEYSAELAGRPIIWVIANDTENNRVWISHIYFKDTPITSYGNRAEVINSGMITSKPIDYFIQTSDIEMGYELPAIGYYEDITPLLAHLLPIRQYRQAKGLLDEELVNPEEDLERQQELDDSIGPEGEPITLTPSPLSPEEALDTSPITQAQEFLNEISVNLWRNLRVTSFQEAVGKIQLAAGDLSAQALGRQEERQQQKASLFASAEQNTETIAQHIEISSPQTEIELSSAIGNAFEEVLSQDTELQGERFKSLISAYADLAASDTMNAFYAWQEVARNQAREAIIEEKITAADAVTYNLVKQKMWDALPTNPLLSPSLLDVFGEKVFEETLSNYQHIDEYREYLHFLNNENLKAAIDLGKQSEENLAIFFRELLETEFGTENLQDIEIAANTYSSWFIAEILGTLDVYYQEVAAETRARLSTEIDTVVERISGRKELLELAKRGQEAALSAAISTAIQQETESIRVELLGAFGPQGTGGVLGSASQKVRSNIEGVEYLLTTFGSGTTAEIFAGGGAKGAARTSNLLSQFTADALSPETTLGQKIFDYLERDLDRHAESFIQEEIRRRGIFALADENKLTTITARLIAEDAYAQFAADRRGLLERQVAALSSGLQNLKSGELNETNLALIESLEEKIAGITAITTDEEIKRILSQSPLVENLADLQVAGAKRGYVELAFEGQSFSIPTPSRIPFTNKWVSLKTGTTYRDLPVKAEPDELFARVVALKGGSYEVHVSMGKLYPSEVAALEVGSEFLETISPRSNIGQTLGQIGTYLLRGLGILAAVTAVTIPLILNNINITPPAEPPAVIQEYEKYDFDESYLAPEEEVALAPEITPLSQREQDTRTAISEFLAEQNAATTTENIGAVYEDIALTLGTENVNAVTAELLLKGAVLVDVQNQAGEVIARVLTYPESGSDISTLLYDDIFGSVTERGAPIHVIEVDGSYLVVIPQTDATCFIHTVAAGASLISDSQIEAAPVLVDPMLYSELVDPVGFNRAYIEQKVVEYTESYIQKGVYQGKEEIAARFAAFNGFVQTNGAREFNEFLATQGIRIVPSIFFYDIVSNNGSVLEISNPSLLEIAGFTIDDFEYEIRRGTEHYIITLSAEEKELIFRSGFEHLATINSDQPHLFLTALESSHGLSHALIYLEAVEINGTYYARLVDGRMTNERNNPTTWSEENGEVTYPGIIFADDGTYLMPYSVFVDRLKSVDLILSTLDRVPAAAQVAEAQETISTEEVATEEAEEVEVSFNTPAIPTVAAIAAENPIVAFSSSMEGFVNEFANASLESVQSIVSEYHQADLLEKNSVAFRLFLEAKLAESEFAHLLNNPNFLAGLRQIEYNYGRLSRTGDLQEIQCVGWAGLLATLPDSPVANIGGYSIAAAFDIFENGLANNMLERINRGETGHLIADAQGNEAHRFANFEEIEPGDVFFTTNRNHTGVVLDIIETESGSYFLISESNGNEDGLIQTHLLSQEEFENLIGPLERTVFLRSYERVAEASPEQNFILPSLGLINSLKAGIEALSGRREREVLGGSSVQAVHDTKPHLKTWNHAIAKIKLAIREFWNTSINNQRLYFMPPIFQQLPGSSPERLDYPGTLDVVRFRGKEVQVIVVGQFGSGFENDIYTVVDTATGDSYRVVGAKFIRADEMVDPAEGNVFRRDEGVKVTGTLEGGTIEGEELVELNSGLAPKAVLESIAAYGEENLADYNYSGKVPPHPELKTAFETISANNNDTSRIVSKEQSYETAVSEYGNKTAESVGFVEAPNTETVESFLNESFGQDLLAKSLVSKIINLPETVRMRVGDANYWLPLEVFDEWKKVMPEVENYKHRAESFSSWNIDDEFNTSSYISLPIFLFHTNVDLNSLPYLENLPTETRMTAYKLGSIAHEVGHHLYDYTMTSEQRLAWESVVSKSGSPTSYAEEYRNTETYLEEVFTETIRLKTTSPVYLEANYPALNEFLAQNYPQIESYDFSAHPISQAGTKSFATTPFSFQDVFSWAVGMFIYMSGEIMQGMDIPPLFGVNTYPKLINMLSSVFGDWVASDYNFWRWNLNNVGFGITTAALTSWFFGSFLRLVLKIGNKRVTTALKYFSFISAMVAGYGFEVFWSGNQNIDTKDLVAYMGGVAIYWTASSLYQVLLRKGWGLKSIANLFFRR